MLNIFCSEKVVVRRGCQLEVARLVAEEGRGEEVLGALVGKDVFLGRKVLFDMREYLT